MSQQNPQQMTQNGRWKWTWSSDRTPKSLADTLQTFAALLHLPEGRDGSKTAILVKTVKNSTSFVLVQQWAMCKDSSERRSVHVVGNRVPSLENVSERPYGPALAT